MAGLPLPPGQPGSAVAAPLGSSPLALRTSSLVLKEIVKRLQQNSRLSQGEMEQALCVCVRARRVHRVRVSVADARVLGKVCGKWNPETGFFCISL